MKDGKAHVAVPFVSQLISAMCDKAGTVLSGDPQKVKEVTDVWTFQRALPRRGRARTRTGSLSPRKRRPSRPVATAGGQGCEGTRHNMRTGGKDKRTATLAASAIAMAGALTVALAVAGLSGVVTQSLAEPIITTQSITPPSTPAPQATTKSPVKPPANSASKPPMAKPTSPPPPSKPVTPQLAAPKAGGAQPVTLQAAAFADLPGWQADDHLAALKTFVKSCDKVIRVSPARRTMRHRSRSPSLPARYPRSNRRPRPPRKRSSNPASC